MQASTALTTDVIVFGIASFLDIAAILRLRSTCKSLHETLTTAGALWEALCVRDFRLSPQAFPRATAQWLALYRRMHAPAVFVWGETGNGRLGLHLPSRAAVDTPQRLDTSAIGAVAHVSCSGWGMHALSQTGRVWFWGDLGNTGRVHRMVHVGLPEPCRMLSSGRTFGVALGDSGTGYVWTEGSFRQPAFPFRITTLEGSVMGIAAGFTHFAVLFTDGSILTCHVDALESVSRMPRFRLPTHTAGSTDDKVVHVTAGADFTAAVTASGATYVWTRIGGAPASVSRLDGVVATHASACVHNLSVTHAPTESVRCYVVRGASVVEQAAVNAALGATRVCKVSHGDWHSGALTASGQVWTWGNGSPALGLGRNAVANGPPAQVRLDGFFVFDIGFGGWHSAALGIEL